MFAFIHARTHTITHKLCDKSVVGLSHSLINRWTQRYRILYLNSTHIEDKTFCAPCADKVEKGVETTQCVCLCPCIVGPHSPLTIFSLATHTTYFILYIHNNCFNLLYISTERIFRSIWIVLFFLCLVHIAVAIAVDIVMSLLLIRIVCSLCCLFLIFKNS